MGNLAAVQKHMVAEVGASILVRNDGGYVARFTVSYEYDGKHFTKESGNFTLGVNKSIDIPSGATNIALKVEEAWFINSWSTIFTKHYSKPESHSFKIWGTTLDPQWKAT